MEVANKKMLTKELIEKQLYKNTVKNPGSNCGCLFVFGFGIIVPAVWFLFTVLFSDENNKSIIVSLLAFIILIACWPIAHAIKLYKYSKQNKELLQNDTYRIEKSKCVNITKKLTAEETGPDYYGYTCDLENGKYAVFVLDEISQEKYGDPVDIGTTVYTVYLKDIPKLYFSEKEYTASPELSFD